MSTKHSPYQNLKTKHSYHDAEIVAIDYEPGGTVSLGVHLCGCGDLPGATVHLVFHGVKNVAELREAFAAADRTYPSETRIAEIIGLARHEDRRYLLDLAEVGSVLIDAKGFTET